MKNHKVRYKIICHMIWLIFSKGKVYIVVIRQPTEMYEMFICLLSDISCQNNSFCWYIYIYQLTVNGMLNVT